jgi:hypothetical protein
VFRFERAPLIPVAAAPVSSPARELICCWCPARVAAIDLVSVSGFAAAAILALILISRLWFLLPVSIFSLPQVQVQEWLGSFVPCLLVLGLRRSTPDPTPHFDFPLGRRQICVQVSFTPLPIRPRSSFSCKFPRLVLDLPMA